LEVSASLGQLQQPSVVGHGALQGGGSYMTRYSSATPSAALPLDILPATAPTAAGSQTSHDARAAQPYIHPHTQVPPVQHFQPHVPWEFPREKLYIRQKIGEGSFSEVWRVKVVDGILGRAGEQLVAVKMLRGESLQPVLSK